MVRSCPGGDGMGTGRGRALGTTLPCRSSQLSTPRSQGSRGSLSSRSTSSAGRCLSTAPALKYRKGRNTQFSCSKKSGQPGVPAPCKAPKSLCAATAALRDLPVPPGSRIPLGLPSAGAARQSSRACCTPKCMCVARLPANRSQAEGAHPTENTRY